MKKNIAMKLKHIHIDNYKLFHDFDIDFCAGGKPLDIVVIAGINGSGKSTLLDYIKQSSDSAVYWGAHDGDTSTRQLEETVLKYVDRFVYVDGKSSFDAYREIQALLDNLFHDFHLQVKFKGLDADRHMRFTNRDGAEFGINELSDGEKQILAKVFYLYISRLKGQVILMDEPDRSLHPSWQSYLLPVLRRYAAENDCQFILATHSPQIISSAYGEEVRLLRRDDEGKVRAESCEEGPYGWTVERVLDEIQRVPTQRVPEIEQQLQDLRKAVRERKYEENDFKEKMNRLENLLGHSDPDLTLLRMEIIRQKKKNEL